MGQWTDRCGRRHLSRNLSTWNLWTEPALHGCGIGSAILEHPVADSAVLESSRHQSDQRYLAHQSQYEHADRRYFDHGRVSRLTQDSVASAGGNPEQYPGSGPPRSARTHRYAGSVGRPANRIVRRRIPKVDGYSTNHFREHDLLERGRGKHDA